MATEPKRWVSVYMELIALARDLPGDGIQRLLSEQDKIESDLSSEYEKGNGDARKARIEYYLWRRFCR
jgi:hypothetical protein